MTAATAATAATRKRTLWVTYLLVMGVSNPLILGAYILVFGNRGGFLVELALSLVIASTVTSCCMGSVALLRAVERWWERRRSRRIARGKGVYFAFSLAVMPGALWLAFHLTERVAPSLGVDYRAPRLLEARGSLLFGTLLAAVAFLWQVRTDARHAAQLAELKLKDAQLAALAAQMNPHLLFNALNTVASLVRSDPERAEETVVRLADLYRGVLTASRVRAHRLADELALSDAYLAVERARFGERLAVSVEIAPDVDPNALTVPVLILQPLVENAVHHGLLAKAAGGRLTIRVALRGDELSITVEDDGVGMGRSARRGAGTALAVLRERLTLGFGERARLEHHPRDGGGTRVELTLPVVPA